MTGGTGHLAEVIQRDLRSLCRFMALIASYGDMTACQRETRLLVLGQREARSLECRPGMALLAAIQPRFRRKLPFMLILVAVGTFGKFDLESRLLAGGNVASCAGHLFMRKLDRIAALGMIRDREKGRTPALFIVATHTLSAIRPLRKLTTVRIWIMAVFARLVRDRHMKIRTLVAGHAVHFKMLADQRKVCLRVIKFRRKPRTLPCHR